MAWLCLACAAPSAAGQLKVGQPLDFGSASVGSPVTLDVVFFAAGTTTVASASVLTDGATGADFAPGIDTCLGTVQQNADCEISVIFTPKQVGVRHGVLLLYDGSHNLLSQVFLHGIGTGGAFAFAPASVTSSNIAKGLSPATFTAGSAVLDGYGNLYFTDVQNHRILEQTPSGTLSQIASLPVTATSGIAIAADGTLFVSAGSSVYAFQPGSSQSATPTPLSTGSVTLVGPSGLAVDSLGNLYIADISTGLIAKYSLETAQTSTLSFTTLAPPPSSPKGLALDASNNLYIADSGNDRIVEVSASSGSTSVLAFSGLTLNDPSGLAIDPAGTVYVTDTGNSRLVELTVNGVSFALTDPNLKLTTPTGVLIKPNGDLILSDTTLGQVLVPRSVPSLSFPTATVVHTLDSTDGAETLTLQATGNSVAQLVFPATGTEPTVSSTAFAVTTAGTCPSIGLGGTYTPLQFTIGDICTYTVTFTPTAAAANNANFEVDISLPSGSATYTTIVPLTGTGISSIASFSLVASPSATAVGAPVGLTLTALNASNGIATDYNGTVSFTTTDSTGVFLSGSTYTFTTANQGVLVVPASAGVQFNQPGTFTVHTTDGQFQATSNSVLVRDATAVTSFKSSLNPSLPNQTSTLGATVNSTGPAPTGTVTFYNGSTPLGTVTLSNSAATFAVSFPTAGTYTLTAVYNGDVNNAAVTSSPLIQTVLYTAQIGSFTSSVNPALASEATVLTATLSGPGPTPTGTVQFLSGGTLLGTATLKSGVATLSTSFATVGTYGLSAVYSGDTQNTTATASLSQLVVAPVVIALASSASPSLLGQQVTLSTTISSSTGTPSGAVQFFDGATLLGSTSLTGGKASIPATFTTTGIHTLTVAYSGDAADVAATSAGFSQDVVAQPVVKSFTSSVNPSLLSQSTTLSLSLTSAAATLTGSVKFYDGTTLIGTGTLTNGATSIAVSFSTAGTHSLTAAYTGDLNNAAVTTSAISQTVQNNTAVTLTSSANPALTATTVTLTATLSPTTATGTVAFFDGSAQIGSGTVNSGVASAPVSFNTTGLHSLTAVYAGDSNDTRATSSALSEDVQTADAATLTTSASPVPAGQPVTLTASLKFTGAASPTGSIAFYSGGTLLGSGALIGGTATLSTTFTTAGAKTLTCQYPGDTNFAPAACAGISLPVQNTSSLALVSSANPANLNQSVTFTATVSSAGATPTGSVSFYNGTALLTTVTLASGSSIATFTTSVLPAGTDTLRASYSGDAVTAASTNTLSQTVLNPATIQFNCPSTAALVSTPTTLTATVTSTGIAPTGTVKFFSGSTLLGTGTLSGGVASFSASFSTAGTQTLTAVYSGDSNNGPVTSSACSLQVLQPATVVLTSAQNPSTAQGNIALTATVTSAGPTPTGQVRFYSGTTLLATVGFSNGTAVLYYTFPTAGTYNLTAVYAGDQNTAPATSTTLSQVVRSIAGVSFATQFTSILIGNPTVLSATVTSSGVTPTGTVTFLLGTAPLGSATLVNGTASLTVSFSQTGYLTLTAMYSGDANNAPSTSSGVSELVGDMSLSVAPGLPTSASVLAGGTVQYALLLTPLVADPFPSDVSFSITGLPTGATATFAPSVVAAGQSTSLVVLSITVPAIVGDLRGQPPPPAGLTPRRAVPISAALLLLPMAFLRRRRLSSARNQLGSLLLLLLMAAGAAGLSGCVSAANSGFYGLAPQTYPLTVTATSGQLSRTTAITLTVQ